MKLTTEVILQIKSTIFFPHNRSTIYKFRECTNKERIFSQNEKITLLEFLWYSEQALKEEDKTINPSFTEDENNQLVIRMLYQSMRYNVIDSLYKILENITKIKPKTKFYDFIDNSKIRDFKTNDVLVCNLNNYHYFRSCLDNAYVKLNHQFREFHIAYLLKGFNKFLKEQAEKADRPEFASMIVSKDMYIFYIFTEYKKLLPDYPLKNTEKINFFTLMDSVIARNSFWYDFCEKYNVRYPEVCKKKEKFINLHLQTFQYKEQITIYLAYILDLIKRYPNLPLKELCNQKVTYDAYYEDPIEDNLNVYGVKIKETPFIPIETNVNRPLQEITLQDINRYIAILVQAENHFYSLLESILNFILYHETTKSE